MNTTNVSFHQWLRVAMTNISSINLRTYFLQHPLLLRLRFVQSCGSLSFTKSCNSIQQSSQFQFTRRKLATIGFPSPKVDFSTQFLMPRLRPFEVVLLLKSCCINSLFGSLFNLLSAMGRQWRHFPGDTISLADNPLTMCPILI